MAATTQPHQQVGPTFLNRNKCETTLLAKRSLCINSVRGLSEIIYNKNYESTIKTKNVITAIILVEKYLLQQRHTGKCSCSLFTLYTTLDIYN